MLLNGLLRNQYLWPLPFVLQALAYVGVLRKMDIRTWWAFLPGGADYQLTKKLYPRTRTFWRPFSVATLLVLCALYLNPNGGTGMTTARLYLTIAILVYEVFLFRLYQRLSKTFGKGALFGILTFLLPPLGLFILGLGKAKYTADPTLRYPPIANPALRFLVALGYGLISLAEVAAFVVVVGFFTVKAYPPRFLAEEIMTSTVEQTMGVTGTGEVVTREEAMGDSAANIASMPTSRDKFFPDHSADKNVVVIEYIIGSDLEDKIGLSSANIAQMVEATKKGSNLTFVLETGGSQRWFTKGIKDGSYGRYTVHDGKLEKVEDLPSDTCMSEPQELAEFITWAKENYPADRYMLALWDHGGGLSLGYGVDRINTREGDLPTIAVNEICDAIEQSDIKFDIIGFDACLMQDIEVAAALEPYADYLLASEESEGGFGWSYTSAFGMLAERPNMPSEEFGREIVACYDPYNTIINSDEPDTSATLSFVDLPLAQAAYQQLEGFFDDARNVIADDSSSFANISLAVTKSYTFGNYEQVDLIDFLQHLGRLDYEGSLFSDEERDVLIDAVRACVLYRNGNSAEGVNGIALTFPVSDISAYSYDWNQFNHLSFESQRNLYSDFFSIMAAQQAKTVEDFDAETASFTEFIEYAAATDYTEEEWYVAGFEDYEDTPALVDIPLTEVEGGYRIELPDTAWNIIADSELIAYQRNGELLRYLGCDQIGATDENGHPMVAMDGTWVYVGGKLCCYEAGNSRETEEGTVFTGTTKARLNGTDTIKLYIEWDPVAEGSEGVAEGRVIGYTYQNLDELFSLIGSLINTDSDAQLLLDDLTSRSKEQLQTGDRIEFLFDYYDESGDLVKSEPYGGGVIVSNQERLKVQDQALGSGDIVFGGVLTDVYQRTMTTEKIEAHIA